MSYANTRDGREKQWTGYYATRPELKQNITAALRLNRATNILSGLVLQEYFNSEDANYLLHHDAITGTCRDNVVDDYNVKIRTAEADAYECIGKVVDRLLGDGHAPQHVENGRDVTIWNSLSVDREELVNLIVGGPYVEVKHNGEPVLA
jgi:hypothetical protein